MGGAQGILKFVIAQQASLFEAMPAYDFSGPGLNLGGVDRPEQVKGIHVTADYFRVFGASTTTGRTFDAEEDRPGGRRVTGLSHSLWVARFGSDPNILGRSVGLNGEAQIVVGVPSVAFRVHPLAEAF